MKNINTEKFMNNLYTLDLNTDRDIFKAVRLRDKNFHEEIRVYIEIEGELVKAFQTPLSKLINKIQEVCDHGSYISYIDRADLNRAIQDNYKNIPVIRTIDTLGWQYNSDDEITAFVGSEFIGIDGNTMITDTELKLPLMRGNVDMDLINGYMSKNVIRQIGLLYNLVAPLAALLEKVFILSLSGKSSKGKTTFARLALSQSCSPDDEFLSRTLHSTDNATEKMVANNFGLGILLDDTSNTGKNFNWTQLIYWLSSGQTKTRLGKHCTLSDKEKYHTSIMFTTEDPILSMVDPNKEGNNGRIVEIAVCDNILFDDGTECRKMERYFTKNYGITLPKFIKIIMDIGTEEVKEMSEDEEMYLFEEREEVEPVVSRHYIEFAALRVAARLANEHLGYRFNIEEITDFLIENVSVTLKETRGAQDDDVIMNEIFPEMWKCALAKKWRYTDKTDQQEYYSYHSDDLKELLKKYNGYIKPILVKNTLWENHCILKKGNEYALTNYIESKGGAERSLWIKNPQNEQEKK